MTPQRTVRKLVTDMTPLIDMVTILLFGVMIQAVAVEKGETAGASGDPGAADKKLAPADALAAAEEKIRQLERRLNEQKASLAQAMSRLLQMDNAEHAEFLKRLGDLDPGGGKRFAEAMEELRGATKPEQVYKAVRRIEEMQKVFTFVDLHLRAGIGGAGETLRVGVAGRELELLPVGNLTAEQMESGLRSALEQVNFGPVVLILFSYDGAARDRTVETAETALNSLLAHYRAGGLAQGRQFRYGRIGLVDEPTGR